MENNELVPILECRQPAVIQQNVMDVGASVLRIKEHIGQLAKTRENVAEVKKIRAQLNKDIASWEVQRKMAYAAALVEYEQANKAYQEKVAAPLKEAEVLCKTFVQDVENAVKQECEDALREYFTELCQTKGIFWLPFEKMGIKVTLAMADQKEPKKAMEQIRQRVEQVDRDLAVISSMEDSGDILAEYETSLDLSTAISRVQNRKRAMEIAQENKSQWEKTQQAKRQNLQHIAVAAPDVAQVIQQGPEKKYQVTFAVTATMPMLRGLKAFLDGHNYEYQEVNE